MTNKRHQTPHVIGGTEYHDHKTLLIKVKGDVLSISRKALYHRWIRLQNANIMDHITFHDLRHLNESIMALLRVPDKYAQARGGWYSDQVMKKVYMRTFSEESERVDDMMDGYFEEAMQHEMQHKIKKPLKIQRLYNRGDKI